MRDDEKSVRIFLEVCDLSEYLEDFEELKVTKISQLKYVTTSDLYHLGMSKPQMRRFKKTYTKMFPNTFSKITKFLTHKRKSIDPQPILQEKQSEVPPIEPIESREFTDKQLPKYLISIDDIILKKELGMGQFGVVQQGIWRSGSELIHVAIKCVNVNMKSNCEDFLMEATVLHGINHPNIVQLYGVVLHLNSLMLVTEVATLKSLLECFKKASLRDSYSVATLCDFSEQICEGMHYLESKRLIHRDLAARNILVFNNNNVKISDFGLSRALDVDKDYYQACNNEDLKLPIAWCAPECVKYLRFTSASDVWAYAVCLWEIFTYGYQPWAGLSGRQIFEAINPPRSEKLEKPNFCPSKYYDIMKECWILNPNQRPTFKVLRETLKKLRPTQVEAIVDSPIGDRNYLQYKTGDIITVLSESCQDADFSIGCLSNTNYGRYKKEHTVSYEKNPENDVTPNKSSEDINNSTLLIKKSSFTNEAFPKNEEKVKKENQFLEGVPDKPQQKSLSSQYKINEGASTSNHSDFSRIQELGDPVMVDSLSSDESDNVNNHNPSLQYLQLTRKEIVTNAEIHFDESSATMKKAINESMKNTDIDTMKPMTSHDMKMLELAVSLANHVATRSMEYFGGDAPHSPSSSGDRALFNFKPQLGQQTNDTDQGKQERRNFSDEANRVPDIQSTISEESKLAYTSLIEQPNISTSLLNNIAQEALMPVMSEFPPSPPPKPHSSLKQPYCLCTRSSMKEKKCISKDVKIPETTINKNVLPLPPKFWKPRLVHKPRHVRKHPLVLLDGSSNSNTEPKYSDNSKKDIYQNMYNLPNVQNVIVFGQTSINGDNADYINLLNKCEKVTSSLNALQMGKSKITCEDICINTDPTELIPIDGDMKISEKFKENIKFEEERNKRDEDAHTKSSLLKDWADHVSLEDLINFAGHIPCGRDRGLESDEVRILCKVFKEDNVSPEMSIAALELEDWNLFNAIKIIKLKLALGDAISLEECFKELSKGIGDK